MVGDAYSFDAVDRVALLLKGRNSTVDALLDRGDDLQRVMLVPAGLRIDLLELDLMRRNRVSSFVLWLLEAVAVVSREYSQR